MNNKNVLLINDTSNGYHWGCYGTSTKIKEKIIGSGVKNLKCRTVEQTHATKSVPENVAEFETAFETFKENNIDLIEDIESVDCIIINGEGTIHHFHNGPRALLYIMYISKKMFNKKVFVINHSCFPSTDNKNVLDFYETCYKCCDYVAVREGISFDIVKNKLHINNVILAFDSLPLKIKDIYKNIPEFNNTKKYICLSGAVNFDYSKIEYIIKYLNIFYKHYDLIFLTGSVKGICDDDDIKVYQAMLKYNPNIKLVEAKSLEEWCSVIKSSVFLLSGRYHYTIGAMVLGRKSIQFESNTKKITAIREMFNLSRAIQYEPKLLFKLKLIYELITVKFKKQPNLLDKICSFSNNNYKWSESDNKKLNNISGKQPLNENTWKEDKAYSDAMAQRVKAMVDLIDFNYDSIMDLGCGLQTLKQYISKQTKYFPINQYNQIDGTIIKDFNKGEFLDENVDVCFCSGIFEYIYNLEDFIYKISCHCKYLVGSYCFKESRTCEYKLTVNNYSKNELFKIIEKYGFRLIKSAEHKESTSGIFIFEKY